MPIPPMTRATIKAATPLARGAPHCGDDVRARRFPRRFSCDPSDRSASRRATNPSTVPYSAEAMANPCTPGLRPHKRLNLLFCAGYDDGVEAEHRNPGSA